MSQAWGMPKISAAGHFAVISLTACSAEFIQLGKDKPSNRYASSLEENIEDRRGNANS